MSRTPVLGSVSYNTETNWGEVSSVFGTRVRAIGAIDLSGLTWDKLNPDYLTQYKQEIVPGVNGVKGGSFKTKFMLTGHGSSTASGALTLNALETLLGIILGTGAANVTAAIAAGGTTATAGGSPSALHVAAANGYLAGSLGRAGVLGDARGNGQFFSIHDHTTSIITTNNEIDAALNNGDVVYNPVCAFVPESPVGANDVQGTRWLLQTANGTFECHGCYPKAITWAGLNAGQEPSIEITWGVSWWVEVNTPLPNATAVQTFPDHVVAGGSLFFNVYGTATRNAASKLNYRDFTLTHTIGIVEEKGPGGNDANQIVTGCKRTRDMISIELTLDAEATGTHTLLDDWTANSVFHMMLTLSPVDGSAIGLRFPYLVPDGPAPTQNAVDNLNRVKLKLRAGCDASKATELERAALIVGLA